MTARFSFALCGPAAFLALIGACIESRGPAANDKGSAIVVPEGGDGDGDGDRDAGPVATDSGVAGTGRECAGNAPTTPTSCYGFYCGTNYAEVRQETPTAGACGSDTELMMICDGPFPAALAVCARSKAGYPDDRFQGEVEKCIRADTAWNAITEPCMQCYLEGAACAKKECVIECVGGDSKECDDCREDSGCTPAFYTCAMMPDPQ